MTRHARSCLVGAVATPVPGIGAGTPGGWRERRIGRVVLGGRPGPAGREAVGAVAGDSVAGRLCRRACRERCSGQWAWAGPRYLDAGDRGGNGREGGVSAGSDGWRWAVGRGRRGGGGRLRGLDGRAAVSGGVPSSACRWACVGRMSFPPEPVDRGWGRAGWERAPGQWRGAGRLSEGVAWSGVPDGVTGRGRITPGRASPAGRPRGRGGPVPGTRRRSGVGGGSGGGGHPG